MVIFMIIISLKKGLISQQKISLFYCIQNDQNLYFIFIVINHFLLKNKNTLT